MTINRRKFLQTAAAAGAVACSASRYANAASSSRKVVLFDAFPIFDPRPIAALGETLFPGKGSELANLWRTRQFEYQWLRTLSGHYADFWRTTSDALVFACRALHLDLSAESHERLMNAYLTLAAWPDAPAALRTLKERGFRLAFLSNFTERMLDAGIRNAGLDGLFEHVLSTDRVRAHKPDARAYAMALDTMKVRREDVVFAAFAGWDAAGAKSFGYRTFWVNRLNQPQEELGDAPDGVGRNLDDLLAFV